MKDGILKSGLLVSEGDVVVSDLVVEDKQDCNSVEISEESSEGVVEENVEQRGSEEQDVLVLEEKPSEVVEVGGELEGGSADQGDTMDMSIEGIILKHSQNPASTGNP